MSENSIFNTLINWEFFTQKKQDECLALFLYEYENSYSTVTDLAKFRG